MLHCFLDRLQPSGSLILNLYDRWKAKEPGLILGTQLSHTTNVISTVGLITLGTLNCAAGLNASHTLSPFMAGKRDGEKGGSSQLQSNPARVPSCSSPELRLETYSKKKKKNQIIVCNLCLEKCRTVAGFTIEGRRRKWCVWEYLNTSTELRCT